METPAVASNKVVVDYQATDLEGNPIGSPTHLEADTWEEMSKKQQEAHVNATRALARQNKAFNDLKSRKITPKEQPAAPRYTQEEEQQIATGVLNPATAKDAIRKIGGINDLEDRLQKAEARAKEADAKAIAYTFMRNHLHEYFPCQANSKVLWDWLVENNLEYTLDNLEIAFAATSDQLAQDPKEAHNNLPIAEQTAPSPAQSRQPSFGVQPGIGSGTRPPASTGNGKMTRKDVLQKKKSDPAWWKKVLNDPTLQAEVNAALAR